MVKNKTIVMLYICNSIYLITHESIWEKSTKRMVVKSTKQIGEEIPQLIRYQLGTYGGRRISKPGPINPALLYRVDMWVRITRVVNPYPGESNVRG